MVDAPGEKLISNNFFYYSAKRAHFLLKVLSTELFDNFKINVKQKQILDIFSKQYYTYLSWAL